jgi:hypothetical protein
LLGAAAGASPGGGAAAARSASACFARQANLAAAVDADDLDQQLVAFLDDLARPLWTRSSDSSRDVDEAIGAGQDLDEGAELDDAAHGAQVEAADLGLTR